MNQLIGLFICLFLMGLSAHADEKTTVPLLVPQSETAPATAGTHLTPAPLLTCWVTYAGTTQTVVSRPVADPYPVPSVDIGGRFWFKAVMVGDSRRVDRILLYAYLDASPQPVLIHQAKYLPPFSLPKQKGGPLPLTGLHYLYAGLVERELIYSCNLEGLEP